MTQDDIIEMAVQAGIERDVLMLGRNLELLEAFAKLVAAKHDPKIAIADAYRAGVDSGIAAEREACAKECEHTALRMGSEWMAQHCAEAIRARGQHE
jgi:hypothetical protein